MTPTNRTDEVAKLARELYEGSVVFIRVGLSWDDLAPTIKEEWLGIGRIAASAITSAVEEKDSMIYALEEGSALWEERARSLEKVVEKFIDDYLHQGGDIKLLQDALRQTPTQEGV